MTNIHNTTSAYAAVQQTHTLMAQLAQEIIASGQHVGRPQVDLLQFQDVVDDAVSATLQLCQQAPQRGQALLLALYQPAGGGVLNLPVLAVYKQAPALLASLQRPLDKQQLPPRLLSKQLQQTIANSYMQALKAILYQHSRSLNASRLGALLGSAAGAVRDANLDAPSRQVLIKMAGQYLPPPRLRLLCTTQKTPLYQLVVTLGAQLCTSSLDLEALDARRKPLIPPANQRLIARALQQTARQP